MPSFWERLTKLRTGLSVRLISRMRSIRCASPDDHKRFVHCPLFFASEVGHTGKNSRPETSCSRFIDISCSCNRSDGFFLGDSFLSRCRGSLHARGSADSPLFVCRDHSTPPLLGSKHGLGSAGFRWSYADNFWVVLARGANCTNVHLVYRKPASMPYPLRAEVQMLKCLRPTHIAVERANGYHASALSRGRSLRTVAVAVGRWSSSMITSLSLALCNRESSLNP